MAEKELTVFVVDLHPSAKQSHDYLFDVLAGKLLKGLKTDYISVLAYHSPRTEHKLAEKGVFPGIEVLVDFEVPTYDLLANLKKTLTPNESWESSQSDSFQSLIFSLSLLEETKKKAFTRNVVVLTAETSPLESLNEEKADGIPRLLQGLNVNLITVIAGAKTETGLSNRWSLMNSAFSKFVLLTSAEAQRVAKSESSNKKVRPMSIYRGELRFSANFQDIIDQRAYNAEADDCALAWPVEVFPAAKKDVTSTSMHDYLLENGELIRLERKSTHYVWSKNDEYQRPEYPEDEDVDSKKFDKVAVESKDFTSGFKFSNFDLIALDEDLMDSARLKIFTAFDILGFVKQANIPQAYLTGESFFVVPEKSASLRTSLNHSAFVKAIYELKAAALARFVRKQAKEIELGVLFPIKVDDGGTFSHNFLLIRLPFKEDEKIGNFPPLQASNDLESDASSLMEQFIKSQTYLGGETKDNYPLVSKRVTMRTSENSKLPLPGSEETDPFLVSSPAQARFTRYMKTILVKSLTADNLDDFFQQKEFVNNVLRDSPHFTNFLNMANCLGLSLETDWLSKLQTPSKNFAKRLVDELDVSYVRKADIKKRKPGKSEDGYTKGNYGADEGQYDEVPDFGF